MRLAALTLSLPIALLSGCDAPATATIDTSERVELPAKNDSLGRKPLRVAVGAMITPKAGFAYYRDLLDHVGASVGMPVEFIDRKTYAETNQMLAAGNVDVAFVCGRPYVDGYEDFGLELLVAPQVGQKSVYYSYIIVDKNSDITELDQLEGRKFAFTDPHSNSGALAPTYLLQQKGRQPENFFAEILYSYGHDKSIEAVALGVVDGAAVDSLIWEYEQKFSPQYSQKTRVIEVSEPYGIPPVTVIPNLDPILKGQLRGTFLSLHKRAEGRKILESMGIERFVTIEDSAYDSIRKMKRAIAKQQ